MERIPGFGKIVAKSKEMTLPGLMKVPLYDVMRFFGQSLSKGVVFQRAAAITYRVFVAVIPIIIALFSAIAFLGEEFRNTIITLLESVVPPYVWPAVSDVITDVVMRQNGTLSSFMFVIGIYFTIVCINGILVALTSSYYTEEKRNILKQIALSAGLMMLTFVIIVVVAALFIMASVTANYVHTRFVNNPRLYAFAIHLLKWVLVYAAIYFLISIFYYLAPVRRGNYRFFSAGSSTCTILLVALMWFVWNKTTFGKNMFAVGSNAEAARVSGVNVFWTTVMVHTLAGAAYGFAGYVEAARLGSITASSGLNNECDAIAACVIGGVSFVGGTGKISGIVLGVFVLRIIFVALTMLGIDPNLQYIIKGAIILAACSLDMRKYLVKK